MADVIVDRRKPDAQIKFLTSILQSVQKLTDKIEAMQEVRNDLLVIKTTLSEHIARENTLFEEAFPYGNASDHRKYHEALIRKAEEEHELFLDAKKKLVGWGLRGLGVAILVIVIFYWNAHMPESAHITVPLK